MKLFNKYIFLARYLPALITLFPASIIYFFVTKVHSQYGLTEYLLSIQFFYGISATFIITYFVSMIIRELGSLLETRYFHRKQGFPSTYNLLWSGTKLSHQDKYKYREKIKSDFEINLFNEQQETYNTTEAIKLLNQATRLLSTKYQQHPQVGEANISYGFARNMSGGALIALPISIAGIIVGFTIHIPALTFWSFCFCIIFLLIALFHKHWIIRNAEKYSEKILAVYFMDKK